MNGWFLAAGALLAAAFFVHVFSGNRFYTAARPEDPAARPEAYEAWLMGRCGVQMISVDLFLAAGFLLLSGGGTVAPQLLDRGVPAVGLRRLGTLLAGIAGL